MSVAGEELGLSIREICSSLERGSRWITEPEATRGSTTRLRVVSSGREVVTLGNWSVEAEALDRGESTAFRSWSTENWVEEIEDLEAREISELGWLEAQELGLVVLGQLKGAKRGSLKLEKQGTVLGTGVVSKFCKVDLDGGVDKDGCRFLKSSRTT
jgi:hypothetical protein